MTRLFLMPVFSWFNEMLRPHKYAFIINFNADNKTPTRVKVKLTL